MKIKRTLTFVAIAASLADGATDKGAWGEMGGVMTKLADLFEGMPTTKSDKSDEAMKAFGEITPKTMALQAKVEPIGKKLEEAGKKYGIDLSKVASGK